MPKRPSIWIFSCVILTLLAVIIPSLFVRLILAMVVVAFAVLWFALLNRKTADARTLDQTRSPENFEVHSLLDATLTGMREGLLVVDKDMRVVASNPAARKLFNPTVPALESQRLTELTRNPAIYGAFLDGLKGMERSGIKVETHGPERQIFDLRVVPIGRLNGNGSADGALGVFFDITRTERLEQMLTNLIENAIKFSREHSTVSISHEPGTRDRILVRDNGDGIPAQHLERLFERFYRVDRARSRDMGGTGLGLAIVKHIALLHGGEVTVTSEVGKGSTFTIHLPNKT